MMTGVRRLWMIVLTSALMCVVALSHAVAVQPDEVLADGALEQRARILSAELRCVVCQNQSIDDSDAPLARDLRLLVRERLVAGDTDPEVMAFIVARYGEFVLLRPRFGVHTAVLWLLPLVLLGGVTVWLVTRRRVPQSGGPATPPASRLTDEEEQALSELLKARATPVAKE